MDSGMVHTAYSHLREWCGEKPDVAVVLGSGMGPIARTMLDSVTIQGDNCIPRWPQPTVEGHAGRLYFGKIGEKNVLLISGRVHYYEGRSMDEVTFYVRVLASIGIKALFLTCATGATGRRKDVKTGEIRIVSDHINMLPNPLIGPNLDKFGPRFVDMSKPYDCELTRMGVSWLRDEYQDTRGITGESFAPVTLLGLTGPTFETPAEYKMGAVLGADVVGMSTVPEVIVANHCGMRVFASTIVTDNPAEDVSHEEVQKVAAEKAPVMASMICDIIRNM
jgi:purine-nucleoside phosphorylase